MGQEKNIPNAPCPALHWDRKKKENWLSRDWENLLKLLQKKGVV